MELKRAQRGENYSFLNFLRIDRFIQKPPLPRWERVGVRGRGKMEFPNGNRIISLGSLWSYFDHNMDDVRR